MLTAHAIGLAIVVGVVISLNLRLLGLYGAIPYTSLHELMSIGWIGVAINAVTGVSLFTTQATFYVTNFPFLIKITSIVVACVSLAYTQKVLRRDAAAWQAAGRVTSVGRALAGASLFFWVVAVVAGRLIAYL